MHSLSTSRCPEVSVLLSCYNESAWLAEAIESVLNQTFEGFELLLIDDGSSDQSLELMKRYEKMDDRITIAAKQHSGLTDSLICGVDLAKGRWVARQDADDVCEPTRLAEQISYVMANGLVLTGSGFHEVDGKGGMLRKHHYPSSHDKLVRRLMRSRGFFPHSSAFFSREAALQVGSYNRRFVKSQDRDLWLKLAANGKIGCVRDPLVRVRKHSGSISNTKAGRPQMLYGTAAACCYSLRQAQVPDPSAGGNDSDWDAFLDWIAGHSLTRQAADRRKKWNDARALFFEHGGGLRGLLAFAAAILRSGSATQLLREKIFGPTLPGKLAAQWAQKSCAAS